MTGRTPFSIVAIIGRPKIASRWTFDRAAGVEPIPNPIPVRG